MDDVIEALAKTSIFGELSKRHLGLIARVTDRIDIAEGQALFTQGQPTTHMSIIVKGRARVEVDGAEVATLGPGDVIGELSMVDGEPASATVTFTEPSTIFHTARTGFVPVWDKNPDISKAMLLAVVQRLRNTNALVAHS